MRLIKFAVFLFAVIAAGCFLLGLSFGEKTLYQHLVTISETDEARALKTEIEKKVDSATTDITKKAKHLAIEKVKDELEAVRAEKAKKAAATDSISQTDNASLDALIEKKRADEQLTADRRSLNRLIRQKNKE